jgi:hypothetical protein
MMNFIIGFAILLILNHFFVYVIYRLFQLTEIVHYISLKLYFLLIGIVGTILAILLSNLFLRLISENFELKILPMILVVLTWLPSLKWKFTDPVYYHYRGIGAIIVLILGYFIFIF